MDVEGFLQEIRSAPDYAGQIVHLHHSPKRDAILAENVPESVEKLLAKTEIKRLYSHQAEAIQKLNDGKNVLVCSGTASGKSLCYALPILQSLAENPKGRSLLLFPTKALCQDQAKNFARLQKELGLAQKLSGVFDGDTPSPLRRRLRDNGSAIFSNPDMAHASLMSQHARWADFLSNLKFLVLDEMHVYSGIFGSNMGLVLRRFFRICAHYGSNPLVVACSATIGNPKMLAEQLTGKDFHLVETDGSPKGARTYVWWNPPRLRSRTWRSRRSANVEAHELMAGLVRHGVPTITFSKAKMTAEMIYRYVKEKLEATAPQLRSKITPYRGGYLPAERRDIERRLFAGELLGVSTTPALELGIDVGVLEACIVVGYPGTRASFFQQSGRAGRKEGDSVVFLIGLDTSINQYIMSNPEYIFEKCVEEAVIEPENPYVVTGHIRCAVQELALSDSEAGLFGPHAQLILRLLEENQKVKHLGKEWYHAVSEIPQHEVSLRSYADENVVIQRVEDQAVLGQVNKFDAEPILHPGAIYMHNGESYRVLELDLDRNIATVKREETDYYTDPLGGTDIHHIDEQLRQKRIGSAMAYWGEVTAYFNTHAYQKIHFYSLDPISQHGVDLPTMVLETMAFWLVPSEELMLKVREAGHDAHSGLRGIGYATRMILPLFMTCDTLDFSHTVGSSNSPWNAIFIYERYPHGLGFTEKAFHRLHEILPRVRQNVQECPCDIGCPCCVGKPLRQFASWNVELGEASIPSKRAALMILDDILSNPGNLKMPEDLALTDSAPAGEHRLEQSLRRRLARMREAEVFHPIRPMPDVQTKYPDAEGGKLLKTPDASKRAQSRRKFEKELQKRIAKKIPIKDLSPFAGGEPIPAGMKKPRSNATPLDFPGRPVGGKNEKKGPTVMAGDALAAKARRMKKKPGAWPNFEIR